MGLYEVYGYGRHVDELMTVVGHYGALAMDTG